MKLLGRDIACPTCAGVRMVFPRRRIIKDQIGIGRNDPPCSKSPLIPVATAAAESTAIKRPRYMFDKGSDSLLLDDAGNTECVVEGRRRQALLKTGALQN